MIWSLLWVRTKIVYTVDAPIRPEVEVFGTPTAIRS